MQLQPLYLLTGATGFIGSQVLVELLQKIAPDKIYILCRKKPASLDSLLGRRLLENFQNEEALKILSTLHFVESDFFDEEKFKKSLADLERIQESNWIVVHMAAQVKAPSFEKLLQVRINVGVTEDLKIWAESHAAHFLFVSSVVAFGVSFQKKVRSEWDFEQFPWICSQMAYFQTKRKAHLSLLEANIPRISVVCPSVVHGSLEEEKNSRGHLSAVRQGRLKISPPGGINIVSLKYVAKNIAELAKSGGAGGAKTYLLCGENILTTEYLLRYQKLHGSKPDQKFFQLPSFLGLVFKSAFVLLKMLKIPTSTSFETAVASFGYLFFSSKVLSPDENVKY